MPSKKKSTYTPAPNLQGELLMRVQTILAVQGGILTVSEAAKRLGMSRNHFQTLMHRGLHGLVEAVMVKPAGRPAKPQKEAKLEEEVKELRKQNATLKTQLDSSKRFLSVASQMLQSSGRQTGTRPTTKGEATPNEKEDPDGAARAALKHVDELVSGGASVELAAAAVGKSSATVRRWRRRTKRGAAPRSRRGRRPGLAAHRRAEDASRSPRARMSRAYRCRDPAPRGARSLPVLTLTLADGRVVQLDGGHHGRIGAAPRA